MFQNFLTWILSFFYTASPAAARIAGRYIAINNRNKAAAILPLAETALLAAKNGTLSAEQMKQFWEQVDKKVDDSDLFLLLCAIEIPNMQVGTVNSRAILILESFIEGCQSGVQNGGTATG